MAIIENDNTDRHRDDPALTIAISAGPIQAIIRPTELERAGFRDELLQLSLFGSNRLFTLARPTITEIDNGALVISHDKGRSIVRLDTKGHLLCRLSLQTAGHGMILIEEDVMETLVQALRFSAGVLDRIDSTHRLTHIVIAATISGRSSSTWRTRKEQEASPNSWSGGFGDRDHTPVHLDPAVRPRAALVHQQSILAEDLVTLLRRQAKSRG